MTARALITGTLFRAPERKVSRNDRPFVQATVKTKDGDASTFWRVFAFSESVQEELLRLHDGDALSVSGSMRAEIWAPDGKESRVSLTLTADAILPLRREKQPREKQRAGAPRGSAAPHDRSSSARRAVGHRSPSAPHGWHESDADIPF
ncbi:single-stranded DNA-binding protein [Methylocystis sp. H62]|uniref:single-stranded DNA-binding protein n=1 Tax=Methylocystis sp. H62 TaxID=2785789 RepID=UPI0018C27296|nr:single-stranded DNA-binding protein [Methylocystis sp. H62]MBG0795906.1 single-stranded DNA-binding protein [Methylocystis sp. H62]